MGRYDISFKVLAESNPSLLLRVFGRGVPAGVVRIQPVDREVVIPIKSVDQAFLIETSSERWIEHFEAESSVSATDLGEICARSMVLALKYRMQVWTTVVLLSKRAAAEDFEAAMAGSLGTISYSGTVRYVRLWEQPAELILAQEDVQALPIVAAMDATLDQIEEVARRLERIADHELRSRLAGEMVTWSSLRYNKTELAEVRLRMGVNMKELLLSSWLGQEIVSESRAEGLQQGLEQGLLRRAIDDIRYVADSRFPGLLTNTELEQLTDLEVANQLFRQLVVAPDRAVAAKLIRELFSSE